MPGYQHWKTPRWLFDALNAEFGPYELDAAASKNNALCDKYLSIPHGLDKPWAKNTFCNPPFSRQKDWVKKALLEFNAGNECTLILSSSVNSQHFHWLMEAPALILFPTKRIAFERPGPFFRSSPRPDILFAILGSGDTGFGRFYVEEAISEYKKPRRK